MSILSRHNSDKTLLIDVHLKYVDLLWLCKDNMRKRCHQQVNWANNLRQVYCHLRQTVQYLHNIFNCLEMTPAALNCPLIAVELCNLETTMFLKSTLVFNGTSMMCSSKWHTQRGLMWSWKCAIFVWKCDDNVNNWINILLLRIWR